MKWLPPASLLPILLLGGCQSKPVNLERTVDPDIVLVNIEEGDRAFIGELILKVDSLDPVVIGINAHFAGRKDYLQDSVLMDALKKTKNDVLIYEVGDKGNLRHSEPVFSSLAADTGALDFETHKGLVSKFAPIQKVNGGIHESFALKIARRRNPALKHSFEVDQRIPINFKRTLRYFTTFDGSFMLSQNASDFDLSNKIFLLGYIGPKNENTFKTPMQFVEMDEQEIPYTYGLVIVANQIRTILEYGEK